jgi:O-antigen/teichoic acid export membrane protein
MRTFFELMRHWALAMTFHVAPRFANVVVFIFIGRLAGPDQAGVFSLATTYLLIITTITRGLDDLLIRQVGREPGRAADYFGNFLLLRLVLSAGLYIALVFFLRLGPNYSPVTITAIVILALSVVPDSLGFVAQSILLGHRRFGTPAAALGAANLFKVVAGGAVLLSGGELMTIAWLWLIGSSLGMIALLIPAFRQVGGIRHAHWLNFAPLRSHWRASITFCAITTLTALDSQVDTVLLSVFRDEADVGWYNAATTVTFFYLCCPRLIGLRFIH